MVLKLDALEDKMKGCWVGKNIGGVLGAPDEGFRRWNDLDFYIQDLSMGSPPNDDLDLQIIWLAAVEKYGRNVNAAILGEYWISYVLPNWVEYGTGKANLRAGLMPPMSGELDNTYKDSCGCFIRSEIWACLAPGHPQIAARYAYEDAIVDHAGEGMYAEIFCAALQSAAFAESDPRTLIEIGLSYIPKDSAVTRAIRTAVECYNSGIPVKDARRIIHNTAPGTFGIQHIRLSEIPVKDNDGLEIGAAGFDAPENVAYMIAAWLYGEGDFGKSICLANAFGEDTDCICATLGATMGIISGASGIPEKWSAPLDDRIATMCINRTWGGIWVPETATQLAERIMRTIPAFLGQELCDIFAEGGMEIICRESNELFCRDDRSDFLPSINGISKDKEILKELSVKELCNLSPYVIRYEFPVFRVQLDYLGSVFYKKGESKKLRVKVINNDTMRQQEWAKISLYLPDGAAVCGSASVEKPLNNNIGSCAEAEFEICTENFTSSRLEFIVDVSLVGRHSSGIMKVIWMCEG
jgi:ADP-ribosylglycohydrolase